MMKFRALVGALFLSGCTVEQQSSAPTSTSTLGSRVTSRGEMADAVFLAMCERAIECGTAKDTTVPACFDRVTRAVPVDRDALGCSRGQLNVCTDAIQVTVCADLGAPGKEPEACKPCDF